VFKNRNFEFNVYFALRKSSSLYFQYLSQRHNKALYDALEKLKSGNGCLRRLTATMELFQYCSIKRLSVFN